jgi:hypothetical protein
MPRQIANVDTATETFSNWIDKTNELIAFVNTVVITTNTSNVDVTTGNAYVNGYFGANTLGASVIVAGNATSNGLTLLTVASNTKIEGFVNVTSSIAGGDTRITGFINVSSTANIGGVATFRANVIANGELLVSNVASLGNTTITGFINVSSSVRVSDVVLNTTAISVSTAASNVQINASSLKITNSTSNITINIPSTTEANGSYYLNGNGSWVVVTTGGISAPGGANTEVQFNDSGALQGNNGFTFNNSTKILTVANGVVSNNLTVNSVSTNTFSSSNVTTNNVILTNALVRTSANTTTGTSQQAVDAFAAATFRSADYVISIKDNDANAYQISRILVIHHGGDSFMTEYGTMFTNTSLGTFASDLNTGSVRLLFTPTSSNTTLKIARTTITV